MRRSAAVLATVLAMVTSTLVAVLFGQPSHATSVPASYYENDGPHGVTVSQEGPDETIYYPSDISSAAAKYPVLIWGNGTGATPAVYDAALRHWASWGIVVAAANTTQSGTGREMLAGARYLIDEGNRSGSKFYGRIDGDKVGAAGHSQGGGGTIAAAADPLVKASSPIEPGPQGSVPMMKGPALFIAGQLDYIVPSPYVRGRYSTATQIPAVFAELAGSDHFFPGATRIRLIGVETAWFRYWLAGDEQARGIFFGPTADCGICNDRTAWSSVDRNAKARAV
ncbi:acetylxylan esterase [Fodinicola acaciae]|uniref:poly(ethylene terephthalate) hydrolase family protein n=1 Tax=Fodinicola acaciae TaxID=2681555 RepID=UPI0013D1633A|nr:acetylxylan esterase [Fodinicola acaciae]